LLVKLFNRDFFFALLPDSLQLQLSLPVRQVEIDRNQTGPAGRPKF
jgi:hypothetical protein